MKWKEGKQLKVIKELPCILGTALVVGAEVIMRKTNGKKKLEVGNRFIELSKDVTNLDNYLEEV